MTKPGSGIEERATVTAHVFFRGTGRVFTVHPGRQFGQVTTQFVFEVGEVGQYRGRDNHKRALRQTRSPIAGVDAQRKGRVNPHVLSS